MSLIDEAHKEINDKILKEQKNYLVSTIHRRYEAKKKFEKYDQAIKKVSGMDIETFKNSNYFNIVIN